MRELLPITLADQLVELLRELKLRKAVYPKWVIQRRITQARADWQIACLEATIRTLKQVNKGQ